VRADRKAEVVWKGDLMSGSGTIVSSGSGALSNLDVNWKARTESSDGSTSPEELIAAAHAACYAMAFSNTLATAGHVAERLSVDAVCHFEPGKGITRSDLAVSGRVAGLDAAEFQRLAKEGEQGCPVSNALRGNVEISLDVTLES
jgi:osmotically inducible protein OsmC